MYQRLTSTKRQFKTPSFANFKHFARLWGEGEFNEFWYDESLITLHNYL